MTIKINKKKLVFHIEGKNSSYVFCIENKEQLRHLYWGSKIKDINDFDIQEVDRVDSQDAAIDVMQEEYAPFGNLRYKQTALKVTFEDGTRDVVYKYLGYDVKGSDTLIIRLKDVNYNFYINLHYKIFKDLDIIKRWVEVDNQTKQEVNIEKVNSAMFNFYGQDFHSSQVSGHWCAEHQFFREKLTPGIKEFRCLKGVTGNNHSPYFILDRNASEDSGEVYFGALAYSGNWSIKVETTQFNRVLVGMGINDFDFCYPLKPNEKFITPEVYAGYTDSGFSKMTHVMNDLSKKRSFSKLDKKTLLPVLFNSWEATKFDISVKQQLQLAKKASNLGVELFVVDDGWFGKRNGEKAGLGDWFVNKKKFPKGLSELVNGVKKLGMDFGIWVEPEMVSPNSKLYKEHPDWVYHFEKRKRTEARYQLVLNVTRKDVQDYLFNVLNDLLSENDISYIKWDMNRPISEPGALNLDKNKQKSFWYHHVQAVYNLVDRLRKNHPHVHFESCASGGSRTDYGVLKHFDQVWPSDNTDALDRLLIQEGYSYMYPIRAMRAWVTDVPNKITNKTVPLEFRLNVAMSGILGLGGNLVNYSNADLKLVKEKVKEYKKIRPIVQDGLVYRLHSLNEGKQLHAVQYVHKKESVLFTYMPAQPYVKYNYRIKLKGLDKNKKYRVIQGNKKSLAYGDYLMNFGLQFKYLGDFISEIIYIKSN